MKKTILILILIVLIAGNSKAQLFLEQFSNPINGPGGSYAHGYIFGPITESKPGASELNYSLTNVGGHKVYEGVGHTVYGTSDLDVSGQVKVRMRVKSDVDVNLRIDLIDAFGNGTDSIPVTIDLAGNNTYTIIEFTDFTLVSLNTQTINQYAISGIEMYFNPDTDPALTGNVTIDWFYIGNGTDPCNALTPSFSSITTGLTVDFTSSITGGPVSSYIWDFGDGSPSNTSANPPSYTYLSGAPSYDVSLIVYDTCGTPYEYTTTVYTSISGIHNQSSLISSAKMYPNPSNDQTTLELNLKSEADVKIVLSDLTGKKIMTISEGSATILTKTFDTSNLHKGVYTVSYIINGVITKSELLLVQ
jgi:hypothetical protein